MLSTMCKYNHSDVEISYILTLFVYKWRQYMLDTFGWTGRLHLSDK